jgi:hypothetical protein
MSFEACKALSDASSALTSSIIKGINNDAPVITRNKKA